MSNLSQPYTDLSPDEKRALLAEKLRQKAGQGTSSFHPLSHGQRALWFLYQLAPQSTAYNIMQAAHIRGTLDIPALHRAVQALLDRHRILRTTYTTASPRQRSEGEPAQCVHKHRDVHFEVIDASTWSQTYFDAQLFEEADRPFNLEQGPVLRLQLYTRSAQAHVLLMTVHHIAIDFWSLDMLMYELRALYAAQKSGAPTSLPPLRAHYTDYVRWQAEMLAGREGERLRAYWQHKLAGELPTLNLPTDHVRPPLQTYRGAQYKFKLRAELSAQLKALAKTAGVTTYVIMLAAFQVLLHRYSGQDDILVGSPALGRSRAELEEIVGYLINPVVLRADFSGAPTFKTFLDQVHHTVLSALEHQDYPFPLLVEHLQPARDPSRSPLFQVMFIWDKSHQPESQAGTPGQRAAGRAETEFQLEPFASEQRGAAFDLTLTMFEIGDALSGAVQYNVDLFEEATIARMVGHFQTLLLGIVADPQQRVSYLPLLTSAETRTLHLAWNQTEANFSSEACVQELFEAQVRRTPQAVACICGEDQLTYRELNQRANRVAHYLQASGVGPEALVGICVERSLEMVIGLLGILKAGGAYVPLDPAYPQERLAFMLQDSRAQVLLTQERLLAQLPEHEAEVICLDRDWKQIAPRSVKNPAKKATAENLAYVIYTSGSTGKPKGVQISHRAVVNLLHAMRDEPGLSDQDVLIAVTSLSFDIAALELFLPLIVGARLVVAVQEVVADGRHLSEMLVASGATAMQATPATWRLLLEAGWQGSPQLKILSGGEALPRELAEQLLERGSEVWNLYGPTETTIWSAVYRVSPHPPALSPSVAGEGRLDSRHGSTAIGRPITNTQFYVLDTHLQPVPVGVPGELHIGGDGLAHGYLERPELTAEKFIMLASPGPPYEAGSMGPPPDIGGEVKRFYKTGDLVRYLPDGNLEFLGRIDHQVKVRGFRIELGEIESTLNQHPAVRETVVIARSTEHLPSEKSLLAYVVPTHESLLPARSPATPSTQPQLPRYELPNGMLVAHHSSFQSNAIYKEIFEDLTYLQHGIALSDGDCVLDVGANIGLFTLFVHETYNNARVFAFEPIPPNFERLQANVAHHGVNARVFNFGLSDRTETTNFTFYPQAAGLSERFPEGTKEFTKSIILNWLQNQTAGPDNGQFSQYDAEVESLLQEHLLQSEIYTCRLRTLSDVMNEYNIERIDLLKIDVEKSELDVLRGIRAADWRRIKQITIEVHTSELLDQATTLLQSQGYEVFVDKSLVVEKSVEYVYMLYAINRVWDPATAIGTPAERLREPDRPALSVSELRRFLGQQLPEYMLPTSFVFLDALPLTPNGKVDRRALLEASPQDGPRPELDAAFVAPRNPIEQRLAEIWAHVLGVDQVGINDNFFELGGASIQVLKITTQAAATGLELKPELFFIHQTIAELAAVAGQDGVEAETEVLQAALGQTVAELPVVAAEVADVSAAPRRAVGNMIIESIGVYLPPKVVTTQEVVAGSKNKILFPIEQLTGIKSRRMAGETEFSIDLAKKAVTDCLGISKYSPADIDLLICCNISRCDGPHYRFSYEPNASVRLKAHFGFEHALVFDLTNACTGMFTAITIVEAYLRTGLIRRGMVVSGEYISHLTQSAQNEIEEVLDPLLACLTLGDGGAALILEESSDDAFGFHALDMYTLGKYSSYCIAELRADDHSTPLMYTDSVRLTAVTLQQSVAQAAKVLRQADWSPDNFQHLIMHQTSETSLKDATREINRFYNKQICNDQNVICNLAERGNTATTTHFVAVMDNVLNGKIKRGDNVIFGITGSGLTTGTALYTFDDLPERLRKRAEKQTAPQKAPITPPPAPVRRQKPIVHIESVGTVAEELQDGLDTFALAKVAGQHCLAGSSYDPAEVDLLLYTGVYHTRFLSEPAIATIVASDLQINADIESLDQRTTFAFDIFNGALGLLNACHVAVQMIEAGKATTALIITSEIENNAADFPEHLLGLQETGSALMLAAAPDGKTGFGSFVFKDYTDHLDAFAAYTGEKQGKAHMYFEQAPDLEERYLACILETVRVLLELEGLQLAQIKTIVPPQISSAFISNLSDRLNVAKDKFVDIVQGGKDYYTSSLPYALQYAREQALVKSGDIGLIINVGAGIQVGCATYYF